MSLNPDRRNPPCVQPQIAPSQFNDAEADESFAAFSAMRRIAQAEPGLTDNKYFCDLQDTAYANFLARFEAIR